MDTLLNIMKNEIEKGYYATALIYLDKYIADYEHSDESYDQQGELNHLLKNTHEAINDFTLYINIEPENPVYYYKRAELKEELEDYVAALNDYNKAYDQSLKISEYNSLSTRFWNDYDYVHQILIEKNRTN